MYHFHLLLAQYPESNTNTCRNQTMPLFSKVKNCELSSLKIRCLHPPKVFCSIFTKIFLLKYFYNRGYLPRQNGSRFPIWSASPPTRSNIMFVVAVWTEYTAPAPLKCLSLGFFFYYWCQLNICLLSTVLFDWETGLYFFRIISDFTGSRFTLTSEWPNSYDVSQILYFVSFQRHHDRGACFSKVRDFSGLYLE